MVEVRRAVSVALTIDVTVVEATLVSNTVEVVVASSVVRMVEVRRAVSVVLTIDVTVVEAALVSNTVEVVLRVEVAETKRVDDWVTVIEVVVESESISVRNTVCVSTSTEVEKATLPGVVSVVFWPLSSSCTVSSVEVVSLELDTRTRGVTSATSTGLAVTISVTTSVEPGRYLCKPLCSRMSFCFVFFMLTFLRSRVGNC
jgi:hypothetical protein